MEDVGGRSRESDLRDLAGAARAGDQDALERLLDACREDLLRVVRRGLPRSLRRLSDSQDFVQAVWATFFLNDIDPARFESSEQLLAYLRTVASNKVIDQIRRKIGAQKRSLKREVPLSRLAAETVALACDETPSRFAIAREAMERLLEGQPAHYRRILELRAEGASVAEAASAVGLNEGTVRRVLGKMLERAADRGPEADGPATRTHRARPR
jgi:RNA polymerase sigma factor (sigma-70 family)